MEGNNFGETLLNADEAEFDPDTFTLPVYLPPAPPAPRGPPAPKIARSRHDWSREQYDVAKDMNDGESLRAISGQIFGGLDYEVPFTEKPPKATQYFLAVRGVVRWCAVCGEEHVAKVREDDERSSV